MSTHRPRKCFRAWAVDDRDPVPTYGLCWWCALRFLSGWSALGWWIVVGVDAPGGLDKLLCTYAITAWYATWAWLLMRTLDRVVKGGPDAD